MLPIGADAEEFRPLQGQAAGCLGESQVPAKEETHIAKARFQDQVAVAGPESQTFFAARVHLVVLAQHLAVRADEDGRIVEDAFHLLLGHHAKGQIGVESRGPLGQVVDGVARHPFGQVGEAHPTLVAGGGQLREHDQIHILLSADFLHEIRHAGQVLLNLGQAGVHLHHSHGDFSHEFISFL